MKTYVYIVMFAAVLLGTAAQAGLINWSGIQNIRYEPLLNGEITPPWELDINGDSILDYAFTPSPTMVIQPYSGAQHSPGPHLAGVLFGDYTDWKGVTAWQLTSNLLPTGIELSESTYWDNVSDAYLGTCITLDGDNYYGWLHMSVSVDTEVPANNYAIFHDWAYNTQPGVGIMTGTVPEPSTWALFLCGGIALLTRLRQRRKHV